MTVVNPKSISGINSITTGSGSDDLLTIHTNNGTERLRIDSTGATKIVTGIVTTLTATTGIVTTLTANTVTSLGAVSGTTGTFSGAVSGTTGTFTGDLTIPDKIVHTGDTDTAIRLGTDTVTVETAGNERVRISSGGNFGINQTNPQYLLHVTGTTSAARIACNDSASGISALAVTNESNADLETTIFTNRSSLGSSVNIPISFHTNGKTNEKIRMHTTGELSVPSGVTLGLTAADKTASNTLDDYEEGSFSPGFSGDSSSGSYGYSRQAGRYTKIGNVVYYQLYVTTNAVSANATGNTLVTGLPFTSTGGNDYPGSCIGYYNGWNGIVPSQALLDISNTRIYIYKNNNGSSVTHSVPTDVQIGTSIILTGHYYTAS